MILKPARNHLQYTEAFFYHPISHSPSCVMPSHQLEIAWNEYNICFQSFPAFFPSPSQSPPYRYHSSSHKKVTILECLNTPSRTAPREVPHGTDPPPSFGSSSSSWKFCHQSDMQHLCFVTDNYLIMKNKSQLIKLKTNTC